MYAFKGVYSKYHVYDSRHYSSFPGQLGHMMDNRHRVISPFIIIRPLMSKRGIFDYDFDIAFNTLDKGTVLSDQNYMFVHFYF